MVLPTYLITNFIIIKQLLLPESLLDQLPSLCGSHAEDTIMIANTDRRIALA